MQNRIGSCKRKTKETDIELTTESGWTGKESDMHTGIRIF